MTAKDHSLATVTVADADALTAEGGPASPRRLRRLGLALLLVPPLIWLAVAYLGSLVVLLVSAFWTTNSFTGAVVRTFTADNINRVLTDEVFRTVTLRTIGVALVVTVLCAVLAVPLALYMAKIASPRVRLALVVAVTTPLWASYLVKAYAWRMLFSPEG
ncbi:MAG: putative spermidine/putrescine transport system permease protein, partial [Mycobacterium sp.]|nr:putative spermidine/putrescine transport system permease protein [Mycobacterium sp.]